MGWSFRMASSVNDSVSILPAQFPRGKLELVGGTSWKQLSNTSYNKGLLYSSTRIIGFFCFSTGYYVWISFTFSGNSYLYPVHVAEAQLQLPVTCSLLSFTSSCCRLFFPYLSILFPLVTSSFLISKLSLPFLLLLPVILSAALCLMLMVHLIYSPDFFFFWLGGLCCLKKKKFLICLE